MFDLLLSPKLKAHTLQPTDTSSRAINMCSGLSEYEQTRLDNLFTGMKPSNSLCSVQKLLFILPIFRFLFKVFLCYSIAFHPMLHYEYIMLSLHFRISQRDYYFLCWLHKLSELNISQWPSLFTKVIFNTLTWLSWRTARTRRVYSVLSPHSNVHEWLRPARI